MAERCACTHKKVDHYKTGCPGIISIEAGPKSCPCAGFTEPAPLTREDLERAWDEGYVGAFCKWATPAVDDFPAMRAQRERNARSRNDNPYSAGDRA